MSPANIGFIPGTNGALYILGHNVPSSYANLSIGYWITTDSGVAGFSCNFVTNLGWTFYVATGDGFYWGVTPQNPWTLV